MRAYQNGADCGPTPSHTNAGIRAPFPSEVLETSLPAEMPRLPAPGCTSGSNCRLTRASYCR
eukprot:6191931-Pleurochrysis_carterae.AAC.6